MNSRYAPEVETALDAAAMAIAAADALLIGAGAGMGVDSGLPDFRGNEGFWKAYPPFRGKSFAQLSTPHWFRTDPQLAWGFFGHRLHLYRNAIPHAGFEILHSWGERLPGGYFVFTSNVDGQFQRAGYSEERIVECHGSIGYLQCTANCSDELWPSDGLNLEIDETTIRCRSDLPRCLHCREIARPNILMFGDWEWNSRRTDAQQGRFERWLRETIPHRLVVIELGAGLAVPTVRWTCERSGGRLIRINPREAATPVGDISMPLGALEALRSIDERLKWS